MKSKLVNIIHDDLVCSVVPEEEELYKKLLYKHMILKKDEYNPWISSVPLEAVYGKAPVGCSWADVKDEGVLHG
jgi:DNA polymerase I-like protein with 3'-5' exonuclease and polymerase domains